MIEKSISTFVGLLNSNWDSVSRLEDAVGQKGLLEDWAQASWEALVEATFPFEEGRVRLVVYGDGADCNPSSSRFSAPRELPTHQVRCNPTHDMVLDKLSGNRLRQFQDGYALDRFVSFDGAWFFEKPPFDHALLELDGCQYVVELNQLIWSLAKTSG